eukprot:7070695-Prymnesium_polylepis.1
MAVGRACARHSRRHPTCPQAYARHAVAAEVRSPTWSALTTRPFTRCTHWCPCAHAAIISVLCLVLAGVGIDFCCSGKLRIAVVFER